MSYKQNSYSNDGNALKTEKPKGLFFNTFQRQIWDNKERGIIREKGSKRHFEESEILRGPDGAKIEFDFLK